MEYVNQVINGFLYGTGFVLAYALLHKVGVV